MNQDVYILTVEDIAAMNWSKKSHFLNKNARRKERNLAETTGLNEIGVRLVEVAPGDESTEHHVHHHEEECAFVLSGEATARIGIEKIVVKPGDFVGMRKGGLAHSFKNESEVPFRYLSVCQEKDHDVSDYPRVGKRLFRNRDLTWNLVDKKVIDRPFGSKT